MEGVLQFKDWWVTLLFNLATVLGLDRKSIVNILIGISCVMYCYGAMIYPSLLSPRWKIYVDAYVY